MLTDIFATRYSQRPIWSSVGDVERVLLVQCFRNIAEQLMPYWREGKEDADIKGLWIEVESRLGMELGLLELSPHAYGFNDANKVWHGGKWSMDRVCKEWFLAEFKQDMNPDRYMKERISFIELAFRAKDHALSKSRLVIELVAQKKTFPSAHSEVARRNYQTQRNIFANHCNELNERFRQGRAPLNYHNGFIQITSDEKVEEQIVQPFWKLVSDRKWENVGTDMLEAVDRRDTNGRDPALYAAKALESVIKIISDDKGWTRGRERGAGNYIDNLVAERNGSRFIDVWEKDILTAYFGKVRNPLGHGPGGEPMPSLSKEQTNWAIESGMSWCKSLIERS